MTKAKHYVSTQPTTAPGYYVPAGTPFVWEPSKVEGEDGKETDSEPGKDWEEVTPKAAAAIEASVETVPDDADIEALSKYALEAVAFMRKVPDIGELDKDGLVDAIKSSYEAKL